MAAKRDSSFSSFLVDDGNRRAHDVCLAVAQAQPVSPMPIVLIGEPGSGKTHLLYAIANRLRADASYASILFVSPATWGDEVEQILADPSPIDMARHAVLLVDDLPAFSAKFEPLSKLIAMFLENDHAVAVATEVHPNRLSSVPARLRRQLKAGQTIEISAGDARRSLETLEARLRDEQADALARMELRLRELEGESPEAALARKQSRAVELEHARRNAAHAHEEVEHLRAELALLKVPAREAAQLRARVHELEAQLVDRAKHAPTADDEGVVKRKLAEVRIDAQKAREEARGMLQRAQVLLEELHQSRSSFEEAQRERERQRGEIQKLEAVFRGEPAAGDAPAAESGPEELLPGTQAPVAPTEVTALQDEIHRLQESLVRARSERDTIKSHLTHLRDELDELRRDNDRARADALKERTVREEHIRELEGALVARHGEVEALRESQKALSDEVENLRAQVADGAGVVERLMALLGTAASTPTPEEPASERAPMEDSPIVRADFGDSLRLTPKRTAGVHHIEELRDSAGFQPSLPPLDDPDEGGFFRGEAKTA